jgi:hypothetical protein
VSGQRPSLRAVPSVETRVLRGWRTAAVEDFVAEMSVTSGTEQVFLVS